MQAEYSECKESMRLTSSSSVMKKSERKESKADALMEDEDDCEMEKESPALEVKNSDEKPSFKDLISLQASQGNWLPTSRSMLQRFFAKTLPHGLSELILCTLAALCVLESVFQDRKSEWTMLAQKAKVFLKAEKIDVDDEVDKLADLLN